MDIGRIGGGECASPMQMRQPSLTENLKNRKVGLENQLSEINAAIEALEKNPELQSLLDLIAKVRY